MELLEILLLDIKLEQIVKMKYLFNFAVEIVKIFHLIIKFRLMFGLIFLLLLIEILMLKFLQMEYKKA